MGCIIKSPTTGEESILFKNVFLPLAKGSETSATEYYEKVLSDSFKKDFGDWTKVTPEIVAEDTRYLPNGEPNIFKEDDKYFYTNKEGEIVPFFAFNPGLEEYFSEELGGIVKTLAYNAYITHFGVNFNVLDVFKKKFNLKKTIENFIDTSSKKTENPDILLLSSYTEELTRKVKILYKQLGLIYKEEAFEEVINIDETKKTLVPKDAFSESTTNKLTANVKLKLSFLPNTERDPIFNEHTFVPFGAVYKTLLDALPSINDENLNGTPKDIFPVMLDKIKALVKYKPYLSTLVNILTAKGINENELTEFTQVFNNIKNNFYLTEIESSINGITQVDIKNVSAANTNKTKIINDWGIEFGEIFKENTEDKLNKVLTRLNSIKTPDKFLQFINYIGININKNELDILLEDNIIQQLISNSKYFIKDVINNPTQLRSKLSSNKDFIKLAEIKGLSFEDGTEDIIHAGGGDLRWIMSNPSYIDKILTYIKEGPDFVDKLYNTPGRESSVYLKYLAARDREFLTEEDRKSVSKSRINNIKEGVFLAVQEKNKSNEAINNKDNSYHNELIDTIHKTLAFRINRKSLYNTATPGNKSTRREIGFGLNFISNYINNKETSSINDEIVEVLFEYVNADYKRAIAAKEDIDNNRTLYVNHHTDSEGFVMKFGKYVGNAFKSQLFPNMASSINVPLFGKTGAPLLDSIEGNEVKTIIKEYIKGALIDKIENNKTQLQDLFGENLTQIISIDILNAYQNDNYNQIDNIVADYTINNIINQVEFGKIFLGDASYYKNMVDYNKRVPGSYSSGLLLRLGLSEDDKFFNISVLENYKITANDIKDLRKSLPKNRQDIYDNVNVTDAQAWITPGRWKFLTTRLGKWTPAHDTYYAKITGKNKEALTHEEFIIAAQPLKGVFFDINNGVPTYLKYSQAVLIPDLIKGSKILSSIYDKMTKDSKGNILAYKDQIHEVVVQDAIKVGSTVPNKLNSKSFTKIQLRNKNWKLQQDLHPKGFKNSDVGTQLQKVILSGIVNNLSKDFKIGDKTITGAETLELLHRIIGNLSNKGKTEVKDLLSLNEDGRIKDTKKFFDLILPQLEERDYDKNVLEGLRKRLSIYAIPQKASSLLNSVFSAITKRTLKIQTNGASLIQMSNYGLSKEEIMNAGVIWLIDPKTGLKRPRIDYTNKTVLPGQILLPASFISKYIPNYAELKPEELLDKIDPKILSNIIGYRIPNQKLSSNDPLEVIGILPEGSGDSIVAYSEITTKTGSDFDIDKMFIMMPHYKPVYNSFYKILTSNGLTDKAARERLTKEGLSAISETPIDDLFEFYQYQVDTNTASTQTVKLVNSVEKILEKHNATKLKYITFKTDENGDEYASNLQSKKALQNKLIEIYHGVLSNINNYEDLMSPVDDPFLKNIIKKKFPDKSINNLDSFDIINQILLKHDFMGGNTGVGTSANNLVDHFRSRFFPMEMYSLGLEHSNQSTINTVTLTNGKTIGTVILDQEYSQEYKGTKYKIADIISAVLNGFVDIEKDPYIMKANWNSITSGVGFLLIRSGIHPELITDFIGHPILKEYVTQFTLSNTKGISSKSLETTIENTLNKFNISIEEYKSHKTDNIIGKNILPVDILRGFIALNKDHVKILKEGVTAGKIDTNAPYNITSRLISDNVLKSTLIKDITKTGLIGYSNKLISNNENTFLKHYYDNTVKFIQTILHANPNLFILGHENIENLFNEIVLETTGELLKDQKQGDILESNYYSYLMSGLFKNSNINTKEDILSGNLYTEIQEYKKEEQDNFLINNLEEYVTSKNIHFIGFNNRFKPKDFRENVTNGFRELMLDNSALADKIVEASFIYSGFKTVPFQFFDIIPNEWFILKRINNFLSQEAQNLNRNVNNTFKDQFYRHNWNNKNIVPVIISTDKFLVKVRDTNFNQIIHVKEEFGQPAPFVRVSDSLYKFVGVEDNLNVYFKTFKLGYDVAGRKITEYSLRSIVKKSIFSANNNYNQETINKSFNNLRQYFSEYKYKTSPLLYESVDNLLNIDNIKNTEQIQKDKEITELNLFTKEDNNIPECI